jgi:hypothetical protein
MDKISSWNSSRLHAGGFIIKKRILILSISILILCTGLALADTGVPQVPETQGFVTSTIISAFGTATETDSIVSQNINCGWCGLPVPLPLWYYSHSVYTSSYSENTIADQGLITYTKGITTDTAGMAAENQYNVVTDKIVEFVWSDTGRMVSDESTLLDGVGTTYFDDAIMLCPFASGLHTLNPPFCNIVEEGSSVDLTIGSLTTGSSERHIMPFAGSILDGRDLPVSDAGVELNYNIKLTGFGDIPATGSAGAYMNAHIQEARYAIDDSNAPIMKAEDLVYTETSTAAGDITLFQKMMNYKSQITAPGFVEPL